MDTGLRSFGKLCKEKGFQQTTNDGYRYYYRTCGDGILQLICIYKADRGSRRHIEFGSYSMYGGFCLVTAYNGKAHLPFGRYTTEAYATIRNLPQPKTIEEDYLFMEQYGLPHLDSIQTQRDFIADYAVLEAFNISQHGFENPPLDLCGALLYEKEYQKALMRVSEILAQNSMCLEVLGRKSTPIEASRAEEALSVLNRWIVHTKEPWECYYAILLSTPYCRDRITKYLERWYQKNTEIVNSLGCK